MGWFAYQHITHRLGVKSLAALFYEIFGIQVNWWEFLAFRHLLVRVPQDPGYCSQKLIADRCYINETES
jgi:hypothetical protein